MYNVSFVRVATMELHVHKNHNFSNGDNYINIKKLNDANNSIKYTHNRTRTNYTGLYILVAMTAIAGDGE